MKSYEVKQISTILSHFYNLEKLKNICFYCMENNIFSNYSGRAASKLFFLKNARFSPLPWVSVTSYVISLYTDWSGLNRYKW